MGSLPTDNHLAGLAARGDSDAFRLLLERHYDLIFRVAYKFCGHVEEAEDIAQDVCLALPQGIKRFKGDASFTTWLYRVVVNRAKDVRRRQITARRVVNEYLEVETLQNEGEDPEKGLIEWLSETMNRLPISLREVAVLVVSEGMSQAEAADVLGVKEGTVSWRMSELKKALRELAREEA